MPALEPSVPLTDGITYEILPDLAGGASVAFIVGTMKIVVLDDEGLPLHFGSIASAHRWVTR